MGIAWIPALAGTRYPERVNCHRREIFSKFEKSAGGRFAAEGREMLSDSESTKYTTLRGGGGILNPDSNKFARVGGKHSNAVGVSKLLDSILHLRYQEQVCCCWQLVSSWELQRVPRGSRFAEEPRASRRLYPRSNSYEKCDSSRYCLSGNFLRNLDW